jgi:hypothetical protein
MKINVFQRNSNLIENEQIQHNFQNIILFKQVINIEQQVLPCNGVHFLKPKKKITQTKSQ